MVLQGLNLGLQFGMGMKKIKVYTLIKVNVFYFMYLVFLYLNATLFFFESRSCAKFHVFSQLIVLLVLLYRCLQLVYFNFMYFVISMFIGNPLTSIQVLLIVFWMVL